MDDMYVALFSANIKPFAGNRKMNVCDSKLELKSIKNSSF